MGLGKRGWSQCPRGQIWEVGVLILHLPLPVRKQGDFTWALTSVFGEAIPDAWSNLQGCRENKGYGSGSPDDPADGGLPGLGGGEDGRSGHMACWVPVCP